MLSIWSWIKKHWIKSILITLGIVLALVIPPFVVHWMFKTEASTTFWEYTWNAGDLITYIAGFEAFIGTVFLGIVAVRQNDKANQLNTLMLMKEDKRDAFERQPVLKTSEYSAKLLSGDEISREIYNDHFSMYFDVRNFGMIFVEKSGQFLMLSFCLECSAKSPMKFRLNKVLLLDENNQTLSSHKNLTSFNASMVLSSSLMPNDTSHIHILLPLDALVNQTKCTIITSTSFTSNIDECFNFSITLYLLSLSEDQWKLFFVDISKN